MYLVEAAHNPEVAGSNPAPATAKGPGNRAFSLFLVARGETRRTGAARRRIERCGDGVEQVRKALSKFVDQSVDGPAYT